MDAAPWPVGPVLVQVVGQEVTRARLKREPELSVILRAERIDGGDFEQLDVDDDGPVGEQRDGFVAQHDRGVVTGGLAGEVRSLVELGHSCVEGVIGPKGVDDLFAVQPSSGVQREQFDERGSVPPSPRVTGDRLSAAANLEPPQQCDPDGHRCPRSLSARR